MLFTRTSGGGGVKGEAKGRKYTQKKSSQVKLLYAVLHHVSVLLES